MRPEDSACDECKVMIQDIEAFLKANKTEVQTEISVINKGIFYTNHL